MEGYVSTKPNAQPVKYGYGPATTVATNRGAKRCAYTGRGIHYHHEPGPFCSRECQKRDDNQGPGR